MEVIYRSIINLPVATPLTKITPFSWPPLTEAQPLREAESFWNLLVRLGWLASVFQRPAGPYLDGAGAADVIAQPLLDAEELNSGPHACKVDTLRAAPTPHPLSSVLVA